MPSTSDLLALLSRWKQLIEACPYWPLSTPGCRGFWEFAVIAMLAIGVLFLLWVIWRLVDYELKFRAALRAQAQREAVASPEIMAAYKFKEAADLIGDVTDPKLAEKIREELNQQKLSELTGRPQT